MVDRHDDDAEFDEMLAAARAGSRAGWEHLYGAFAPTVLGFLRSQAAPHPDDLLGEVWLQVVRDLPRFSGNIAQFRAWLLRIARNRLIDAKRRAAARPAPAGVEVPDHADPSAELAVAGRAGDTEQLEQMLGALPDNQRAVLYLRYVLDLSQGEAATVLGISVPAAKMLQGRALRALARRLKGEEA